MKDKWWILECEDCGYTYDMSKNDWKPATWCYIKGVSLCPDCVRKRSG